MSEEMMVQSVFREIPSAERMGAKEDMKPVSQPDAEVELSGKTASKAMVDIQGVYRQLIEANQVSMDSKLKDLNEARDMLQQTQRQIDLGYHDTTIQINKDHLIQLLT